MKPMIILDSGHSNRRVGAFSPGHFQSEIPDITVTIAKLKAPPMDHDTFNRIDCELDENWKSKAIDSILARGKTLLANCDLGQTESLQEVCAGHNYVFMILHYPNFTNLVRIYLRPERRKIPRGQPVEADDAF